MVIQNTAKVGIIRKKFPEIFNWEIENLKVSPNDYVVGSLPYQIYLIWSKGKNDVDLPIELEYDIKNGIDFLGELPIAYWSIPRNSKDTSDIIIQISWDPTLTWKKLEIKQKRYDVETSKYVNEEIQFSNLESGIKIDSKSLREGYRDIILSGFLDESNQLVQNHKKQNNNKNYYHLKQTSKINLNTSNDHSGLILIPIENPIPKTKPSLNFESIYFLDNSPDFLFSFLQPTFQFVYGFGNGLSASFWTLYYATIDQVPEKRTIEGNDFYVYDVSFSKLGEHFLSADKKREIIQIIPFQIRYEEHALGSFSLELKYPEEIDLSSAEVKLYISDCSYCSSFQPSISLPIETGIDKNRILLNWDNPLPPGYFPVIQVETASDQFSRNYFFTYFSALRSLFLAPGSGSNTSYLLYSTLLLCSPLLIGFIYYKKWKNKNAKARKQIKVTETIQGFDPSFDLTDFLNKSKIIAEKVVAAWCEGDMNPARCYISAGIFQRFQIQMRLLKEVDGIKNIMNNFQVIDQEVLMISNYNDYLTVHLKLKCQAQDINAPINLSKQQMEGIVNQASIGNYEEVYSFSRKISAQSVQGKDLIHNVCPSCGASSPFSHNANKCQHCGSIFNSGEADWVLSEITQMIEWNPARYQTEEKFTQKNLHLPTSIQIIEDRASALLWKWIYGKTNGDGTILKRETVSDSLLGSLKKKEKFYIPVVGSAEIKEVQKLDQEFIADVTVRWSFARSSKALAENKHSVIRLRLEKTRDNNLGFSEITCKNCGAPFPEIDSTTCTYCGEPIPILISDWLLESIR